VKGRWGDMVDIAAKLAGRPYPSYEEVDWVLWERTPFPVGSQDEVWQALRKHYTDGETT